MKCLYVPLLFPELIAYQLYFLLNYNYEMSVPHSLPELNAYVSIIFVFKLDLLSPGESLFPIGTTHKVNLIQIIIDFEFIRAIMYIA